MSRLFTDTLRDFRDGKVIADLGEKLAEVIAAVQATGKQGSLTLKLTLKPVADGAMIHIDDDISTSVPRPTTGGTIMFPTKDNSLSRRDPRQPDLPGMTVVESHTSEPAKESAVG